MMPVAMEVVHCPGISRKATDLFWGADNVADVCAKFTHVLGRIAGDGDVLPCNYGMLVFGILRAKSRPVIGFD